MGDTAIFLLLIAVLFALLAAGIWVGMTLMIVGYIGISVFTTRPVELVLGTTLWSNSHSYALASLPLFILMGELLLRSRLSSDMFKGLAPWLEHIPGRLLHVNIFGCALFAAVSGSSAATAATIGKLTVPELGRRNYPEDLVIGTLAGSATLGLLIPPSIILIVYGVATDQSIARLFIAGILPGLLLVMLFVAYIIAIALARPDKIPAFEGSFQLEQSLRALFRLAPIVLLIICVMATIYTGVASPTDAAAVGVVLALILARATGEFSSADFLAALVSATRTSAMIAFILLGAAFLTKSMGFTGIPRTLAEWIGGFGLSKHQLLLALAVFFVVMGCFLDGISVVVLTTAIIMPLVLQAGIDPLWFGIFLVIVVEMAQITPPVGFNLFIIQGLTGLNILRIARAAAPFFVLLILGLLLITLFPQIVTLLPDAMTG